MMFNVKSQLQTASRIISLFVIALCVAVVFGSPVHAQDSKAPASVKDTKSVQNSDASSKVKSEKAAKTSDKTAATDKENKNRKDKRVDRQLKKMTKSLNLTAEQAVKVEALLSEQIAEMRSTRKENHKDKAKMQEEMDANRAAMDKKMAEVLTEEQFAKYSQMQADEQRKREAESKIMNLEQMKQKDAKATDTKKTETKKGSDNK